MELHAKAALTVQQRMEVRRLHLEQHVPYRQLARDFRVNLTTIQRWATRESPLDMSSAPLHHRATVTPDYRAAILAYRQQHPRHGPIRIAHELAGQFPQANRGTVLRVLQEEGLTRPHRRPPRPPHPIPVGRHRIQMDIQQLPAIEGGKGFEYKISVIHLRTRLKYSEIHSHCSSPLMAEVLRRAMDRLPPFFSSGPTTPSSSP
jgi:hypothetical protein